MNKWFGIGRLAQDPEVRYTQSGKAVASFNLAVENNFGNEKKADFIPIVAWSKLAEICGNNIGKGRKILVEGRLQIRSYEDKEGQKKRVAEVIAQTIEFLDYKKSDNDGSKSEVGPESFGSEVFPEEEIPF